MSSSSGHHHQYVIIFVHVTSWVFYRIFLCLVIVNWLGNTAISYFKQCLIEKKNVFPTFLAFFRSLLPFCFLWGTQFHSFHKIWRTVVLRAQFWCDNKQLLKINEWATVIARIFLNTGCCGEHINIRILQCNQHQHINI